MEMRKFRLGNFKQAAITNLLNTRYSEEIKGKLKLADGGPHLTPGR